MKYIRKATKQDAYRISEIIVFNYRINFYPIFKNDKFYFDEMQVVSIAEEYLDEENLCNVFVYDDGTIKGVMQISNGELEKLFVEPVLQGCGIGEKLLNFALECCNVTFLWVLEKNARAIKFYQRNGFHLSGDKKLEDGTDEYFIRLEC